MFSDGLNIFLKEEDNKTIKAKERRIDNGNMIGQESLIVQLLSLTQLVHVCKLGYGCAGEH